MSYFDFNTAEKQQDTTLIPQGTHAKVRMMITPGGYDDSAQGWMGGYATKSNSSEAVYLACEFIVLQGSYAKRRIWSNIGLYSPKNDNQWGNMGRSLIRAILNAAKGFREDDESPEAQAARKINGLGDLNGLEFYATIDVESSPGYTDKNVIKKVITPDHKEYHTIVQQARPQAAYSPTATPIAQQQNKPSWA